MVSLCFYLSPIDKRIKLILEIYYANDEKQNNELILFSQNVLKSPDAKALFSVKFYYNNDEVENK